jgi:hypothetical protein
MKRLVVLLFLLPLKSWCLEGFATLGAGFGGTPFDQVVTGPNFNMGGGDALNLGFGLIIPVTDTSPSRFEIQVGANYSFWTANGGENEVAWTRMPIDVIYYYRNLDEKFRLGWGATYSVASKIDGKGINREASHDIDNALGWTVCADILIGHPDNDQDLLAYGLRYNMIKYKDDSFKRELDASALYLTMTFLFSG